MKKHLLGLSILASLAACTPSEKVTTSVEPAKVEAVKPSAEQISAQFSQFAEQFINEFWQINPGYGVYVGYYKYDNQLPVPNNENMAADLAFNKQKLAQLQQFDVAQLSASQASDYYILQNQIESAIFWQEEYKGYQWDPSNYNVAGVFGVILNTDYKSKDERLLTILERMQNIPAYYEAAKANITTPTLAHTELAIRQNAGAAGLFSGAISNAVDESGLTAEQQAEFKQSIEQSVAAINDYVSWLEGKLEQIKTDDSAKDFRIGAELYEKKFALDIYSSLSAKELYNKAQSEKSRVHGEMAKIADELWPKYFADSNMPEDKLVAIKQLIDHISVKHVARDEFVSSIRDQIPALEKFVMEKNLLEMDPEKPLVVRETPEYQRGFAGASINAPGPYDAKANTYYNVTPLDNFNDEEAESYLREYNHWLLQILNIHEAVPGHYTQLVHSNKSKSLVKSIFGNGAMIEGWAVYTERMMLEEGYGDFEPELWLMYYKWNLRVIMNSIIDYSIQVNGMGEEDALSLMMNEAFQEEAEARGKWSRARLSQVQLTSYFTGYAEIYSLREELKEKQGDKFNLTDFHNQFLSYGSSPVPIIRQMMLNP